MTLADLHLHGTHDLRLVVLSVLIAMIASYVALDLAGRLSAEQGSGRAAWMMGGGFALGTGIWSMHFVAMAAFQLPIPVAYNLPIVATSLLAAVAASWVALLVVSRTEMRASELLTGSALMGTGIATMHYSGMAAMRMQADLLYDPLLVGLSIAIAIGVSCVALTLAFRLRGESALAWSWKKVGSAVLMGAAIPSMHYTGMAAAIFIPSQTPSPWT